jgi:heme d1 biosynthesis radical SAM protein NirJ
MFRVSHFMKELYEPTTPGPRRHLPGPVVIWNLIRRCNLTCKHCYAISADKDFPGELTLEQIYTAMDDLKAARVPVLILSGGEPLLHPHIFEISKRAKDMGFYVGLSTNGTLIDEEMADEISKIGYDYVGISIDGIEETHDRFRRKEGAYQSSMRAVDLCKSLGVKVGLRYTMTAENSQDLPGLLKLVEERDIDKFYFSHLNYAGRGNHNRKTDAMFQTTKRAMDLLFDTALDWQERGTGREVVTGNNDADGAYLLFWMQKNFPEHVDHIRAKLVQWGGNASGKNVANIDNLGIVHPDTMWWHHNLGNVKTRPFGEIWDDTSDPLMAGLKTFPRPMTGRCAACAHFDICGGNSRTRSHQITGDPWGEDPGCYLTNEEIGIEDDARVEVTPYKKRRFA